MEIASIIAIFSSVILVIREIQHSKCTKVDVDSIGLHITRNVEPELPVSVEEVSPRVVYPECSNCSN